MIWFKYKNTGRFKCCDCFGIWFNRLDLNQADPDTSNVVDAITAEPQYSAHDW